jgi:hypothetical protein
LREETVRDLRFLNDNDRIETTISLTKFALKAMTLGARPTKSLTNRDEELEEVSEQS